MKQVTCPECNESSNLDDWIESEVYCEDCGSHPAVICPKCGEIFDTIFEDPTEGAE